MLIEPFIRGRGQAGLAMAKALSVITAIHPEIEILSPHWVPREAHLRTISKNPKAKSLLLIATPSALHTRHILEGEKAGFKTIVSEKPACVSLKEIVQLRRVTSTVNICHGYRMMWGPQTISAMIKAGELGSVFSIEGHYWQSSAAEKAISIKKEINHKKWKNDTSLSGPYDTLLDIGTHWVDLASFFARNPPRHISGWISHVNAETRHRDTHIHLDLEFPKMIRGAASISKTAHGSGNDLEIKVFGSQKSIRWSLQNPDILQVGQGAQLTLMRRTEMNWGSQQWPFHGMGWIEGYIEILYQTILGMGGKAQRIPPALKESLILTELLLKSQLTENTPPN